MQFPLAAISGDLNIQSRERQPPPIKIKPFALSRHPGPVSLQGLYWRAITV
jgi:hypothetical protein